MKSTFCIANAANSQFDPLRVKHYGIGHSNRYFPKHISVGSYKRYLSLEHASIT